MFAALLAKIGLPVLTNVVGAALGLIDTPVTQAASAALKEVSTAVDDGRVTPEAIAEANRHIEAMAELDSGDYRTALTEVNATARAEVASNDPYVRRMRPTFGYIIAITFGLQMLAVSYAVVFDPSRAGALISSLSDLTALWGVGLSVLGVYVYRRSGEKLAAATETPVSGAAGLVARAFAALKK